MTLSRENRKGQESAAAYRHDRLVEVEVPTRVAVEIRDEEALTRVTGLGGDEWRSQFYALRTEQDVFEHFAYNAAKNGVTRANQLDGWTDLDDEAVRIRVLD